MSRSVPDRLKDIIRSADLAASHAGDLDATALAAASEQRDAVLYRIAIVGEAAWHLPVEVQALAPEIPWKHVWNMRNHLVHGYWQVDLGIVVDTIATDLEPLKAAAERLIAIIERDAS